MSTPALSLSNLEVVLDSRELLRGISLEVGAGEILGLVGASGSGKSMTALAIMRLLPPRALLRGAVRVGERRLDTLAAQELPAVRGAEVGMVFQEPMTALNPLMRVGEQVAETARLHGRSHTEAAALARTALEAVGLGSVPGLFERLPYELSGGQRQRVAIAMATLLSPGLLIADEPTTALDVITQAQVLALLVDTARTRGTGLLLITHDLAVVAQMADRVAVMHQGQLVEQGRSAEVINNPQNAYTRSLLGAARLTPKRAGSAVAAAARVLEVDGLVKLYPGRRRALFGRAAPVRAVDGASLEVRAGETVGLVGESGSGKSSLLKVILALQAANGGRVTLLGEPFRQARPPPPRHLRRAIQVVFQDPYGSFDPRWRVADLVAEPFYLMDTPPSSAERQRRVAEVLTQVGLSPADAHKLPHEFSGGQRQRIAIARALITRPSVIAFDEAVSALDVLVREQILTLLAELAAREKLAYLFVTHDLHVVRAIADRVYVMQRGKIVESGDTAQVFSAPRHDYTRALLGATPVLPAAS